MVAGGSAGGGLPRPLALLARDRGGPALTGQLLMCPMLDDRNDTPSAHQMAGLACGTGRPTRPAGPRCSATPAAAPTSRPTPHPRAPPTSSGLPPAFIDVGSAETFRDEDVAYASRIWQAGGVAELHVWPGGFHGFDGIAPHAAHLEGRRRRPRDWLRRLLAP